MVRKLLRLFNRESSSLHQAAYLLGFFAVLSQVLAFLRDRLLAHLFGASTELDIYYAAFRIPDFIFVTVASVVSLSVLVPFIIERNERGKEAVREFVESIFSFFSLLIIAVSVLAYFLMPTLTSILFKGLSAEVYEEIVYVSRIMLLSPIALGFSNLFGSLTQAYNRFFIYAFAPLLYNAGIIFGILVFAEELGAAGVAIGVVLGACMHALIQVPFASKLGLMPRLKPRLNFGLIKNVAMLSIPRTLTLSTTQFSLLFLIAFASLMPEGSISIMSFSFNMQSVPLTIIGVSYSLAAFPTLTRHFTERNMKAFLDQMVTTARHIIFWSIPLAALFVVLRAQIVRVLLGTGEFDWSDTRLTAAALALFVVSTVFQSLVLLFMRAFYSIGRTLKPFIIGILSSAVLIAASYSLVKLFYEFESFRYFVSALLRVEDLPGTVVLMLPLGYTIGLAVSGAAHWIAFEKEFKGFSRGVLRALFEAFTAGVFVATATYFGLWFFEPAFDTTKLMGLFLQGLCAGAVGVLAGVGILYGLGSRELDEVWRAVHAKFWKSRVIATDPEIV